MMLRIYVMRERWIVIGQPRDRSPGDSSAKIVLDRCGVLRTWGTTDGLGQLATQGPLTGTKIDREPDGTEINELDVYRSIPCDEKAWRTFK